MKVKVVKPCADNLTFKMYGVGVVIELPDDRAKIAIKNGLVVDIADKAEKPTRRKKKDA